MFFATALAATEAAAESAVVAGDAGVLASLGIHGWQFAAQLVNFVILVLVLRVLLYRPLVIFMEQRAERIQQGLAHAAAYEVKLKELEHERREVLSRAEAEGREKIALASTDADRIVAEAKEKSAQHEAATRAKLERAADQYKAEALADVRAGAAELVVLAAEKVLRGTMTKSIDQKLVEKALKEVEL